jgi:MscS family membrane protein
MEHSQLFNLKLLRAFEAEGIDFAFPTRTIRLANDDKRQLSLRMLDDAKNGMH